MRYIALLLIASLLAIILVSCAIGPTPERTGFDYPKVGLKFKPRRHVTSDTVRGQIASVENPPYELVFQRTTCEIESPDVRLLISGIKGQLTENRRPLYDEIGVMVFQADPTYDFKLTEEKDIIVPWPGVVSGSGILRTWEMTPVGGGETSHTFAVVVEHYGNTIEFMWRDPVGSVPDDAALEKFFYWTHGIRFYEPEIEEK